jgi:hypothetical protein
VDVASEPNSPVACTLGASGLKTQRARWQALTASFGVGRIETDDGLRLRFRRDPAVERELRALTEIENGCCSWASWAVEDSDDALVMVARTTRDGVPALHAMFPDVA